jgi:putative transposase
MQACATLEIHQAFTSYNNPKGNADTERFMRTLKEECLWLQEWTCPLELIRALKDWLTHYNEHYLHSTLGYQSPRQFERDYSTTTVLRSWPLDKWGALQQCP